jgi:DNA-binding NarL/FixJ family response regulator
MNPVRVLIVDDHRVFAEAIATRLEVEPDIVVVGTAATGREALAAIEEFRPDLVLMDVELAGEDGIEVAARLRERRPDLVLAVVSCLSDPVRVRDAVGVGAFAWVTKDAPIEELLAAIRGAMRGESWIPPAILTGVLKELLTARRGLDEDEERLARLTPRERHVLECMADGLDRLAIAERLYLSANTVRTHVQNILAKLQVHSSLEAVALALRSRAVAQAPGPGAYGTVTPIRS